MINSIFILLVVLLGMVFIRLDRRYYANPARLLNTQRWTIALIMGAIVMYLVVAMVITGQGK